MSTAAAVEGLCVVDRTLGGVCVCVCWVLVTPALLPFTRDGGASLAKCSGFCSARREWEASLWCGHVNLRFHLHLHLHQH